jgi:hypothetical protein
MEVLEFMIQVEFLFELHDPRLPHASHLYHGGFRAEGLTRRTISPVPTSQGSTVFAFPPHPLDAKLAQNL